MHNRYHRYLNLPFEISKPEVCDTLPDGLKHHDLRDYVDEEMVKFHQSLGLEIKFTEVFHTPAGGKLPIHCDAGGFDDRVKINMTWGPDDAVLQWWETTEVWDHDELFDPIGGEALNKFSARKHDNIFAKEEDCKLMYQIHTNRPSLCNVGVLHGTHNPSNIHGRWTLSFRPVLPGTNLLTWDDAQEYYKDYIEEK